MRKPFKKKLIINELICCPSGSSSAAITILSNADCFRLSGSISRILIISSNSTLLVKSDSFLVFFTFPLRAYTPSVAASLACLTEPAADNPSVI